jgi:hypothetical protein
VKPPVTPGFSGFTQLVDTEELTQILDADSGERVDSRSFLRARLLDVLIGDSDRHQDQWDWARSARIDRWVAVPKDRDLAFVRFDGLLMTAVRSKLPHLVKFDEAYPSPAALHLQSRDIDRRHVGDLDWPAWREVAEDLRSRLPDRVIDEAVRRLPAPYYRLDGPRLAARLKARRDGLERMARRFYELLAREAEVHATDQPDSVRLLREPDGSVEVVLAGGEGRYFQRRFHPGDRRGPRLPEGRGRPRGLGGPGRAEGRGASRGGRQRRGDDSAAGHAHVYDASGTNRVVEGPDTKVSERAYSQPVDDRGYPERTGAPRPP